MPNRILKESICVSEKINNLSWFEEVLFYRLIVACDDYGRYDGRPLIIKNKLFPLKPSLTAQTVEVAVNKLANAGLVTLYEFEGRPFLYLPAWHDHQTTRAKSSKYPDPENKQVNSLQASASICMQMQANVPDIRLYNLNNKSISKNTKDIINNNINNNIAFFDNFWSIYPRKLKKQTALTAWKKLDVNAELFNAIKNGLEHWKHCEQWRADNGKYIPYPATFLNARQWEEYPEEKKKENFASGTDYDAILLKKRL